MFNFESTSSSRRLPIYLLLDTSASMAGAPIQAVQQGVALLHNELMNTPQAVETAWISVITFASSAQQIVPLTPIIDFSPPPLTTDRVESTSFGAALRFAGHSMVQEMVFRTSINRGDYLPFLFVLIDGNPTDEWEADAKTLHERGRVGRLLVVCAGTAVEPSIFTKAAQAIPELAVLEMKDANPGQIASFFKWVSQPA